MSERYSIGVLEKRKDELEGERKQLTTNIAGMSKKLKLADQQLESINKAIRVIKTELGYSLVDD